MKFRPKINIIVLIILLYGSSCYCNLVFGSQLSNCLKAKSYNEIVDKGLNVEGAEKENLIYTFKTDAGEKILFYNKNNELGIATTSDIRGSWYWKAIGTYEFITKAPDITYMSAKFTLKTLGGNKFFVAFGKIIKPVVKRIELSNPKTNAKIIGNQNNMFWAIIKKKDFDLLDISAYDCNGKLLKY